jgi:hypothetical protein
LPDYHFYGVSFGLFEAGGNNLQHCFTWDGSDQIRRAATQVGIASITYTRNPTPEAWARDFCREHPNIGSVYACLSASHAVTRRGLEKEICVNVYP